MGVTSIAKRVELGKATVHRILQELVSTGWVTFVPASRTYRLGERAIAIGLSALESLPIRQACRAMLYELRELTQETTALFIAVGDNAVPIEQVVTHLEPKRIASLRSTRPLNAGGAAGRVLLAYKTADEIEAYLSKAIWFGATPNTITDPVTFRNELAKVRERGYAVSVEEGRLRTNGLAFPILYGEDTVVAAALVTGPSDRWTRISMESLAGECVTIVHRFSESFARQHLTAR